ncbi:MAG: diaminopimelate decarboxylase, partial [Rhodothermia bacterium]|nr:diaminopimelate decarboxylase [Rhodothermia bacterium]
VSPAELLLALRVGFPKDKILFSANNMTDEEMSLALRAGVLLNVGELTRLEKLGKAQSGASVSLRINPQYGAGHHEHVVTAGRRSKFGIPLDDLPAARKIADAHDLKIIGLHQHIGSGNLELSPYQKAVPVLFSNAGDFPDVRFVNIGGGLGVPYRPEDVPFDLEALDRLLEHQVGKFEQKYPGRSLEVWMEPGRFLTAEAGVLLVEVNTLKDSFGQTYVGTNSGMSHLIRPAIYGAYHGVVNVSNPRAPERPYHIVGNVCESSDFFAHDRHVAEIREGDVLAILDAGAYGMAMASEYNLRPLPTEIFIDTDGRPTKVREAETPEQLVDRLMAQSESSGD